MSRIIQKRKHGVQDEPISMDGFFTIFTIVTIVGLIPFTYYGYVFSSKIKQTAPKNYKLPSLLDSQLTAVSAVIFALVEIVLKVPSIKVFDPLCKV